MNIEMSKWIISMLKILVKTTRNRKKGMKTKYNEDKNKGKDKGRLRAEAKASSSKFGG